GLQGLAIALLPRRQFIRMSPVLQLVVFAVLVAGYLIQPIGLVTNNLVAAQTDSFFAQSPSYWFLGLYQSLAGSDALPVLAARAYTGVMVAAALAAVAYGVVYVRTLRSIAEEPEIAAPSATRRLVLAGHGPA